MSMKFFSSKACITTDALYCIHFIDLFTHLFVRLFFHSFIYFAFCVLENNDLNGMLIYIQICRKENRIVLTSGLPYRMVSLDLAVSCVISR